MIVRTFAGLTFLALLSGTLFAQSSTTPAIAATAHSALLAFEIADVHVSPHRQFPFVDGDSLHGERYAIRQATMLDLISRAYSLDPSKVQGGPSWLEADRFDIIAKAPPKTTQKALKLMLQTVLKERFGLVTHTGSAPLPAYVMTVASGGKPKMTQSDSSVEGECTYTPGAGSSLIFKCHNMTMEAFAEWVHEAAGGYLDKPVVDSTALKGSWDLDLQWTAADQLKKAGADGISIFDALNKQLGLKLDLQTAPRPVMIVDNVNERPTPNPPGLEKILPPPPPAQFEVATIKPSAPDEKLDFRINSGQINLRDATLKFMITFAWQLNQSDNEMLVGAPKWLDSNKFDIHAEVSSEAVATTGLPIDIEDLREMLQRLLIERFQMKVHMEERPISAYTLIAVNPKLKKADPSSRTRCTQEPGPDGKDPRVTNPVLNRLMTCQNMTMTQIGEEFQRIAPDSIYSPVLDATGLKGSYDFTLSFSSADLVKGTAAGSGDAAASGTASEPNGALSFFDAVSKQLGLKLEKEKRPAPVLVIDHVEEKPTEN